MIAWDGETLAADKQATYGATRQTVTKIIRYGTDLIGATGDTSMGAELVDWYMHGAAPSAFPEKNRGGSPLATMVIIKSDKSVWHYESTPYPFKIEDKYCAFGGGNEGALIAMECGKTAREAVELVCKYNNGCGNGVDVLTLTGR